VLLGTGKELVIDASLEPSVIAMSEVEIYGNRQKAELTSGFQPEGRTFTTEEARRFAGSFADPARMAASFAGVTGASDESNALIIRGNSPRGVLWRINGIEAPNPNHFASEGSSNGVISVLSSNIVSQASLLKGAFSPAYGNALSGVLDIRLREGNSEKREHSFQLGTLGVEASTEGPFSNKRNSSYLVNYRYSTLNVLDRFGVSLSEIGKYSNYQDAAFNTSFHGRGGALSFFGIAGKSTSEKQFDNVSDKDLSDVAVTALSHETQVGEKASLTSMISWSGTSISNDRQIRNSPTVLVRLNENYRKQYWRGTTNYSQTISPAITLETGFIYSRLLYDFYLRNLDPDNIAYEEIFNFKEKGASDIIQGYGTARHVISRTVRAIYGVHYIYFGLTDDSSIEPRGRVEVSVDDKNTLTFLAGKHSRVENLQYYLARDHQSGGNEIQVNKDLGFTRSNHYGIIWNWHPSWAEVTLEGYYQRLHNAPVLNDEASWYSPVNEDSGFITDTLTNNGEGKNYGFEFSLERSMQRNMYYLFNFSLYESLFGLQQKEEQNSSYNGNYVVHGLFGKEFNLSRNATLGINLKGTVGGGRRFTPIDLEESLARGYQVNDWSRPYEARLPQYFRLDLQLNYRHNLEKFSSELRVDIQNLSDRENIGYYYYDPARQEIRKKLQVGLLPVITWRVEF
jgi:hypothetical protein